MRINLTKRLVANAEPRDRPYELRDLAMKGLILRVQPSGYKAWIVEWARGKRKTLGFAGHLTLDEARAQTAGDGPGASEQASRHRREDGRQPNAA